VAERGEALGKVESSSPVDQESRAWRWLLGLVAAQAVVYGLITWLSFQFQFGEGFRQRPILAVVILFLACFALYAASLATALRVHGRSRLVWLIGLSAILFRAILLFSQPIQEIDIYRYLWDGTVVAHGVNPFRYAPEQVLAARGIPDQRNEVAFNRLVRIDRDSPNMAESLHRVHFPELTTVYPPVSQAVFAGATLLTPDAATLKARVTIMKSVLLVFDLATIGLVAMLVGAAGKHIAWTIAYAWCPLVLKEFANSGHLDAIAVFLSTAAILCLVVSLKKVSLKGWTWGLAAGVLLGFAVGAKLYPIVLWPLFVTVTIRKVGIRAGLLLGLISLAVSAGLLAPMFAVSESVIETVDSREESSPQLDNQTEVDESMEDSAPAEPRSGLKVFLGRWEMNDFLFMIGIENLRPDPPGVVRPEAWFVVIPNRWRVSIVTPIAARLSVDSRQAAFLLTRAATLFVFLVIVVFLSWRISEKDTVATILETAFLTLAWFLLLAPTMNPWYWSWALPLLPFARGRAWFALSGLLFIYYLRFWLSYHFPDVAVMGTRYAGAAFFDFVVTWVEFAPWLAWLLIGYWVRRPSAVPDQMNQP